MKDNAKLIELLNKALQDEYQASMQYLQHYNNVRSKFTDIVDHFKEHMADEQKHASILVNRIYILGGVPSINMTKLPPFTEDIDEALIQDIKGEKHAIDLYSDIVTYCESIKDRGTQMMVENILADEVGHIDEFAKFKKATIK